MGIKLGSITELATGLLGSHKIPYTTGAITRLLRLDTLADWVVQTASAFVPSGTGAISRPVQTKLRETISATDFYANGASGVGVDPTGVVVSALGIQAALNLAAISNADVEVTLPQGVFNLGTTTLTIPSGVKLRGAGPANTFINYIGTGTAIDIAGVLEWGLHDFRLGFGSSATLVGIDVRTTPGNSVLYGRVSNVLLAGAAVAGQIGIRVVATGPAIVSENWFRDVQILSVDKPLIRTASEGNFWPGLIISEFGYSNGAIAIDSSCHAEFLQARIGGLTGAGTNKVAYKQAAGGSNIDNIVVDIGAGHTALNVTGTLNTIILSRTLGTTPIGSYAANNVIVDAATGLIVAPTHSATTSLVTPLVTSGAASGISFTTSTGEQFRVVHAGGTVVNFLGTQGSAAGGGPFTGAFGTDTDIALNFYSKGAGAINFLSDGASNTQFQIVRTASATRNITVTGSNGGNPTIGTTAGRLNISSALTLSSLGAFAASDKYLIVDSSGNVHVSAIGPAS